ncbi:c-type cytochrome [Marinicella meishanensis]|uniref:c-type cytochrome n=1 Tax=Marinicella meishanensis TaxID=2873263 RepID=UPI001CBD518C|nr:c-type cytochrome [Marinicella sp. NBU2979]
MSDQDSIFFRNFSILLAALVVFTILLIWFGVAMQNNLVANVQGQADRSSIQELIKPVAAVNTDPNAVAAAPVEAVIAFDGSLDGEMIYNNVCMACHTTGAGGAPKLVAAEWETRLDKGMDAVIAQAINGFMGEAGLMPAKGGRADLSDEQVKVAVEFMTSHLE